jgi:hypothetical protein
MLTGRAPNVHTYPVFFPPFVRVRTRLFTLYIYPFKERLQTIVMNELGGWRVGENPGVGGKETGYRWERIRAWVGEKPGTGGKESG